MRKYTKHTNTDEYTKITRILRNRITILIDTPRLKRKSSRKMSVNVKETGVEIPILEIQEKRNYFILALPH